MIKKLGILLAALAISLSVVQAQTPEEEAQEFYKRGNIYYQQGMFKEAQHEYGRAMEILNNRSLEVRQQPQAKPEAEPSHAAIVAPALDQTYSATEYVIGDDDVLNIAVWQNEDLNLEAIVRPDGKISVPLIGDVTARGMSITRLDEELTKRLSEYVRSPEVSISLKKIGGSKVILLGEISRPGVYAVPGQRTLLEAIGMAGGFTRDAVASSIVLIRGGLVNPTAQRINLSKALKGKDFIRENIVLKAEDVVFVPKKFIANLNYFLTQIMDPLSKGAYIKEQYNTNW